MTDRKLKTWAEVKARRPLSAEVQAANAIWVEQQTVEANLQVHSVTPKPRMPGRLKDRIHMGPDFDDPLPDEILAPFRGEGE